jgi:PKD repeat protein
MSTQHRFVLFTTLFIAIACLVTSVQAAHVQLAWDAPTNDDGTPYTDIAGYKLYYGMGSRDYSFVIDVGNQTTYTVTSLSDANNYYFAALAYDVHGNESDYSNEVEVSFPSNVPPVAHVTAFPLTGDAPLEVTFSGTESSDPDGQIVAYAWQFGDGTTASGATVSHTYPNVGDYLVTLTVTDDQGATHSASVSLTVTPASIPPPPRANLLPNGDMEQGIWASGGFSGTNPTRTWTTDSMHSAAHALKMTGTAYFYGYWNAPVVDVVPGETYRAAMWVRTEGITDGVHLNISWRNSAGQQVRWESTIGGKVRGTHGWQEVSGEVTAPSNAASALVQIRIISTRGTAWIDDVWLAPSSPPPPPGNVTPVAHVTAFPLTGDAPLEVTFSGTESSDPDGQIVAYAWNFGDGNTASGATVTHTYPNVGDYLATLTVTDDQGATHAASVSLTVTPASIPPPPRANLLPNGDMEQGSWAGGSFAGTHPTRTWTTDSTHSAAHALKMTGTAYFYGYWNAPVVDVVPGETYRAAMWVRTEGITDGVHLNISWRNGAGTEVQWESTIGGKVRGTHGWQEVSGEVTAPATSASALVQIRIISTGGTAWVDDVSLQSLLPTPDTTFAEQHTRWEAALTSTVDYANPFLDVTLSVEYTKTGSEPMTIQGLGFWDGGSTFKIRQAFPAPGTWTYTTTSSDPSNAGLHQQTGIVEVTPYTGANSLYQHGFLQVSADRRHLEHADGTPFLWVGDTLWGATVWLTEAGFQEAIDARRRQHFTVLHTNFARKAEVDTNGDTPWDAGTRRWNVRFMRKLDRMFDYANDQGMYLFVNGLIDLDWDRKIPEYERLVEMIAARYFAHYVSYSSSMDDPYSPEGAPQQDAINEIIDRVTNRHLLTQHPNKDVETAEYYYDQAYMDYVMVQTGSAGNLEYSSNTAMDWTWQLYNHASHKPVVNGETWYEGYAGGTGEIAAHLAYLSLLSGACGYTYGTDLWNATDADLPLWKDYVGAVYMQNLYDLFMTLDNGRPLVPRHELVSNQKTPWQEKMAVGVSTDGATYVAFLPQGGAIALDLSELHGTASYAWYHTLDAAYAGHGTTTGGAVQTFTSPFGSVQAVLVIEANTP